MAYKFTIKGIRKFNEERVIEKFFDAFKEIEDIEDVKILNHNPVNDETDSYTVMTLNVSTQGVNIKHLVSKDILVELPWLASKMDVKLCFAYLNVIKKVHRGARILDEEEKDVKLSETEVKKQWLQRRKNMDDIINKGFRRYDVRLKGGSQIVIYNMHMDAGDTDDEMRGNDIPDRLARMVQWRQLRDYILDHLDARPVIVMGDMNSWYERDSIKPQFIDYIAGTGRAIVSDIWIELEREGSYPQLTDEIVTNDPGAGDWTRNGETLDKILYLNPIGGSQLRPVSVNIDSVMYVKDDGTPLGDHNPLSATFEIINQSW
jgi:hypothetical protein